MNFEQYIPPQCLEIEQSLLASCLLYSAETMPEIADSLTPGDFYRNAHAVIFAECLRLWQKKEPVDLPTLAMALQDKGKLEEIGGAVYLSKLVGEIPVAASPLQYAEKIKGKAVLRALVSECHSAIKACLQQNGKQAAEIIDEAQRAILALRLDTNIQTAKPLLQLCEEAQERYEKIAQGQNKPGVKTGFPTLDANCMGGLQPSDLIILAARPSMGKTALAVNIAKQASKKGAKILVNSLEMSGGQLVNRLLADEACISSTKFCSGRLNPGEWSQVTDGLSRLSELPLWIDDHGALPIREIQRRARQFKKRNGLDLLIIDYLQLANDDTAESREREISKISSGLKAIAKELEIPVLALAQLNRELEKRGDKRPILSDLRDSGSIEQDADVVLFLYREAVYRSDADKNRAELRVSKHRNGKTGVIPLWWNEETTKFSEIAQEEAWRR